VNRTISKLWSATSAATVPFAIDSDGDVSGIVGLLGVLLGGPGATRMSEEVEEDEWLDADRFVRLGPPSLLLRRLCAPSACSINSITARLMKILAVSSLYLQSGWDGVVGRYKKARREASFG
jgi:hypothetical protein